MRWIFALLGFLFLVQAEEVLDRQGGHWPKYGSSTLKLKRKIRKLEYQLEQEKMKKSNQEMPQNANDEELKIAQSKIEDLTNQLKDEQKNCQELQKSLDNAKSKIKTFLETHTKNSGETKNERLSQDLKSAKIHVDRLKKIVRFLKLKENHMKFQIVSKIIHEFVQRAFSVLKGEMMMTEGSMKETNEEIEFYG